MRTNQVLITQDSIIRLSLIDIERINTVMGIDIKASAFGILAVVIAALVLYTSLGIAGHPDVGTPLLNLAILIVIAFIILMFMKQLRR